ncbi:9843_t:CDS:10 [Entrophospora sp. SA101]|nr:9843_t:CDS:10 [Entrophospora sp. SA101]
MLLLCGGFLFSLICYVKAREVDGSDNNLNQYSKFGTSIQPFQRNFPPQPFYGPDGSSMIKCPSDIVFTDPTKPIPNCTDPLPIDNFPMPRCISNIINNYRTEKFNIGQRLGYQSKRHTSNMATFFSYFISSDIIQSNTSIASIPIYIPSDDSIYNPPTGQLNNTQKKFLGFNRTEPVDNLRNGLNHVTPFLDLNQLYGLSKEESTQLRDIGNRGKLKIDKNNQFYPMKDPTTGDYILGQFSNQTNYIFTLAIHVIWLREHNRLCDQLYIKYGDSWTDDQYFEEAVIVEEEYFGTILGRSLPQYERYDESLVPGIDVFFETITFKHSHSELGNKYRLQDEYGDIIEDLTLDDILTVGLLEKFGIEKILRSMSLQVQEDSDIYYSDAVRNYKTIEQLSYDMAASSVLRARDRGIALYNDVRQAYGLKKKDSWADITSVKALQDYLKQLYPNGPNQLEAFVGAMVEDHLDGSNFGELLDTSMVTQFVHIRNSDRFWYENSIMFTDDEREILRHTTFRDIIVRNLPEDYQSFIPQNIWMVQPVASTEPLSPDYEYPNDISMWPLYNVKYSIDDYSISFKVTLQTSDGKGWFGMGFDPDDDGMNGADFVIGTIGENNTFDLYNYHSAGYHKPVLADDSDLTIISNPPLKDNLATIEFSRPLLPNGKKGIKKGLVKCMIFFLVKCKYFELEEISLTQQRAKLFHGIAMGLAWGVVFPISIFIVRFFKHTNHYVKVHRFLQIAGGISVGTFGAAVISVSMADNPHTLVGLTLYFLVFLQLAIGITSIWSQAYLVSVNIGYFRLFKRSHKYLGASLLIIAWFNIYLGMDTYGLLYGEDLKIYKIIYIVWISLIILSFINYEILYIDHLGREKYASLPDFTLDEFNDKVQKGVIICDGFVVDIRNWLTSHPGGAKILENVIGTDITDDFYGKNTIDGTIKHQSFFYTPPSVIKPNRKSGFGIIEKIDKLPIAALIDDFNRGNTIKSPLAVHSHSYIATKKMSKMIIAKYIDQSNDNDIKDPIFHKFKFIRFKLIDKSIINNSKEFPIIKFVFASNNNRKSGDTDLDYLPGHYIEVQAKIKGQVVIRNYTPIDGKIMKSFSIIVKIYPNSLISKYLNSLLIGFELQARGPFELGNRISSLSTHTTPIELQARGPFELGNRISLLSTHTTPIKSPITTGFLQQTSSQNDINVPAIPPTLIKYHLKHFNFNNMDNGNRLSMHLLYGNKSFGDQILNLKEQYMEPLYEKCIYDLSIIDSVLSVVYVFNELSPSNEEEEGELQQIKSAALEGKIDKKILKNWFKDIIINNESKSGEGKAEKRTRDSFDNVIPEISNNQLRSDSLNKPNSKIFVCGPMKMMNKIGGILSNDLKLNINDDYILLM